jgi:hypothetical protein
MTQIGSERNSHASEIEEEAFTPDGADSAAVDKTPDTRPDVSPQDQSGPDFIRHVKPYPMNLSPVSALPRTGGPRIEARTTKPSP